MQQSEKYNLVVLGYDWDVYRFAFREFIDNPKVPYIPTFPIKGFKGMVHRLCFNPRLNRILNVPGKQLWTPDYLVEVKNQRNCFLIMENWLRCESATHLLPYLRSHYPESKIVCFVQDLIERVRDLYTDKAVDVEYIKQYADLLVTYDAKEAEEYKIAYFPTVFSSIDVPADIAVPQTDLYFLGRDKGRLGLLVDMCRRFTERGLNCYFLLLGVPKEDQVKCDGIHYIDTPLSYEWNLKLVSRTKCVVELLQPHAQSATFRMWEAIVLNKKLLTNNSAVKSSPCYDSRYISLFEDIDSVDFSFVTKNDESPFPKENPFKENIRPDALVKYIEEQLVIKIER